MQNRCTAVARVEALGAARDEGSRSRFGTPLLLAAAVLLTSAVAPAARADDAPPVAAELARSPDFRVRVSAALVLGRTRPAGARESLERALDDAHSAVRVAAAEALGALGDAAALPALTRRLSVETSPSAKAQIRSTRDKLRAASSRSDSADDDRAGAVRYLVAIGTMKNATGVRGDDLRRVLSEAARDRVRVLTGASVIRGDAAALRQAAGNHVPIITLDGNVTQLTEARVAGAVQIHVAVEFTVRRDQALKGTVSGAATTFGSGPELSDEGRRRLQDDAVDGAVQSALHGVQQGLVVAAR